MERMLEGFPEKLVDITPFRDFAAMVISSEVDAGFVSDRRQEVKERVKEIEKVRVHLKEPALELGKRIDAQALQISAPLKALVAVMDEKLVIWHKNQEQIRIEAEKQRRDEENKRLEEEKKAHLQAAMISGSEESAEAVCEIEKHQERLKTKPIEIQRNTKTAKSTTYLQERWTFEVVDAEKIPREFLMVDETKLQRYATAMKADAKVEGVRFFTKSVIGGR